MSPGRRKAATFVHNLEDFSVDPELFSKQVCPCCLLPSSLLLPRLELSDAQDYGPEIRSLLGTALHFCDVVVLKLRSVPCCRVRPVHNSLRVDGARFEPKEVLGRSSGPTRHVTNTCDCDGVSLLKCILTLLPRLIRAENCF